MRSGGSSTDGTLSSWREYRTFFPMASSAFAVSESTCYRKIWWLEDVLVKPPDLALLGRRSLREPPMNYLVILLDAPCRPIERPKPTKTLLFPVRRSARHRRPKWSLTRFHIKSFVPLLLVVNDTIFVYFRSQIPVFIPKLKSGLTQGIKGLRTDLSTVNIPNRKVRRRLSLIRRTNTIKLWQLGVF